MPEDSENSMEMTMADYSVLCENQQIEIGKAGENLARSCTIDYSAWLKEYGEGDLRIRAIRSGDAEPYPVTNVTTENGVATWIFTDADTAIKGYGEIQILYYVEDVLVKSRVWRTYTHRSLSTSSEEVPDPYQDWLSEVERIGSQIEEDAESASDSATRAAGSASEAAESALSATRSESSAQEYASAASSSAESAARSASTASRSATEASNYEYNSEQYMNEAESARTGAENAKAAAQESATAAAQSAAQAEETAESIEASADLIQKLLANQIHDTATGTIATYPDGADMPMVSLVADIDPIQDTSGGVPSPSNICPISGWDSVDVTRTGKNLVDVADVTITSQRTIASNLTLSTGTYTASIFAKNNTSILGYFRLTSGGSVSFAQINIPSNANSRLSATFTLEAETTFNIICNGQSAGYNYTVSDIMIEQGSTATEYEPYNGQTYQTTLPQTVYGGTLDVVSGVLTVTHGYLSLNTADMDNNEDYPGWRTSGISDLLGSGVNATLNTIFTNISTLGAYAVGANTNGTMDTLILSKSYFNKTQSDWITLATDIQFVVPLATPTTIQLTPTQIDSILGRNTVWADSGDVTVEYIADTKLYIQKVMGAIG